MRNKILPAAVSALAVMTLVGCGQRNPQENTNTPVTTSPSGNQPTPGAAASTSVTTPPAAGASNADNMAPTNSPGTNNPAAPGQ